MRVFACAHYPVRISYRAVSIMHGYRILLMHCDTRILRNILCMRAELRLWGCKWRTCDLCFLMRFSNILESNLSQKNPNCKKIIISLSKVHKYETQNLGKKAL